MRELCVKWRTFQSSSRKIYRCITYLIEVPSIQKPPHHLLFSSQIQHKTYAVRSVLLHPVLWRVIHRVVVCSNVTRLKTAVVSNQWNSRSPQFPLLSPSYIISLLDSKYLGNHLYLDSYPLGPEYMFAPMRHCVFGARKVRSRRCIYETEELQPCPAFRNIFKKFI